MAMTHTAETDAVFDYLFATKADGERYVAKGEYLNVCNFRQDDIRQVEKELIKKEFFYAIRKRFNAKFKCMTCGEIRASAISEHRGRHCYYCRDSFKEQAKLKFKLSRLNHKRRVRDTHDGTITVASLQELFHSQEGKCVYCAVKLTTNYHLDHIHPISKGGRHSLSNVQYLCQPCNNHKGAKLDYATGN